MSLVLVDNVESNKNKEKSLNEKVCQNCWLVLSLLNPLISGQYIFQNNAN